MTTKKNRRFILALASVSFLSALYLWREQDHVADVYPYADSGLDESAFQIRQLEEVEMKARPSRKLAEVSNVLASVMTELPHFPEGLTDHVAQELAANLNQALSSVRVVLSQFPEGLIDHEAQELAAKLHHALVSVGEVLDETRQGYNYNEEDNLATSHFPWVDRVNRICGRSANIINTLPTNTTATNQDQNQVDFVLTDLFHKAATTPEYQPYHSCQPFDKARPTLIVGIGKSDPWKKTNDKFWKELQIYPPDRPFGRTGNQLWEFIRTLQYSRDHNIQLGMLYNAYMLDDITSMFMVHQNGEGEEDWVTQMERTFCIKLFFAPEDLEGVNRYSLRQHGNYGIAETNHNVGKALFQHKTAKLGTEELVARQFNTLRLLYQHYNTGNGVNLYGGRVKDMCSGVKAILFRESASETTYSAIHHRRMELDGPRILEKVANATGCDPLAALDMKPDYIKSILEPLGMLHHPIVVITDRENTPGLMRLKEDPEIGPRLRLVPKHACWVGGDVTLGVVANVFIGNPASTLSGFIARSRAVFGYGNTYMYRARDESGQWTTTCKDDCLFGARVPRAEQIKSSRTDML